MHMQERIEKLREWDQDYWTNLCGTGCCIAGHATIIALDKDWLDDSQEVRQTARRFLDVDPKFSEWLFHSERTLDDFRRIRLVAGYANFPA